MKIFIAILCMLTVYSAGILVFTLGFLLKRIVVLKNNTCILNDQSSAFKDFYGFVNVTDNGTHEDGGCWMPGRYRRAVVVVIDALRFDFVFYNRSIDLEKEKPFENKLVSLKTSLEKTPQNARLYRFVADPPTTTLQRLKGLTTGSLPTFVDAGGNFASPEITEDNFVDQVIGLGHNITFMGDDTWEGLFPGRFRKSFSYPSFNVKDLDTVDNGIIQHLLPEYRQNDWTLLIAHFLGVDHCGHTFGPFHQRMTQKLTQMDTVLRSLMQEMTDDTILFVLGDHGMTKTGDHGGDSQEEVDAAMFVFSPQQITASPVPAAGFKTLSQVDFVPTLSLLLGLPIPFSNLGSVVTDLFDYGGDHDNDHQHQVAGLYRQVMTLHLNAQQVHRYTKEYAKLSSDLPHEKLAQLNDLFFQTEQRLTEVMNASKSMQQNSAGVKGHLESLRKAYEDYLSEVKTMCRNVWAQFDVRSMLLGGFLYCSALLVNILLVLNGHHSTELTPLASRFLKVSFGLMVFFVTTLCLNLLNEVVSCLAIVVAVGFMLRKTKLDELGIPFSKCKASFLDYAALLSCLVYFLSLFSNSYVVYEDAVTAFLFQTLVILLCVAIIVNVVKKTVNPEAKHGRHTKIELAFLFIVLVLMLCVLVGVRLSQHFRACREEQWTCETSMFLQPLSFFSKSASISMNFRLLFSISGVAATIYGTYWWMRYCGNLNGSAIAVVMTSYVIPFSGVTLAFYWLVLGLVQNLPNFIIPPGFLLAPPRFVYIISLATIVVVVVRPLCLFLVLRKNENDPTQNMTLPSVSGEVNIIPQIYNQLKLNYKRKASKDASNSDSQPPVVYGLATVYSSSHLVLLLSVVMVIMLLLGDGVAPSVFLLWFVLFALLELCAGYVRTRTREHEVPWIEVVTIFFLASEHFFATGHQATITTIRWESAFHGFSGEFSSNVIPALLIIVNTFSSQLMCTVALPLVTYWQYTRGHWAMTKGKVEKEENRGELILNEDKNLLRQKLFDLYTKYILLYGLKMLATMLCVAIHRRHLMVWKIFAPRFVFEGATFILISVVSVFICLFVLRVDQCIDNWIKKIDS